MSKTIKLTKAIAQKVLDTVDQGLCKGVGKPVPGQMCVEAAVCFALGLPHGDDPPCVGRAVRAFKIRLNDSNWSSDKARAKGMREVAIAQLGSDKIDQVEFAKRLAVGTVREILPIVLRVHGYEKQAVKCEQAVTLEEAQIAAKEVRAYAADAATYAADAAAYAAYAADGVGATKRRHGVRDGVLATAAAIAVRILIELGTEGTKWLSLTKVV